MEILYKKNMSLRFIAILLSILLLFSSVANTKKVYADSLLNKASSIAMISVILTALLAQGAISSEYKVTAPDISSICEKAQANLQAAGSAAIDQANKLGDALKSGAESAKIKALASGAVIYAFLRAIQDVLAPDKTFADIQESTVSGSFADYLASPLTKQVGMVGPYAVYIKGKSPYFTESPVFSLDSSLTGKLATSDSMDYYIKFMNMNTNLSYNNSTVFIVLYNTSTNTFYNYKTNSFTSEFIWLQNYTSVKFGSWSDKTLQFYIPFIDDAYSPYLKMVLSALAGQSIGYNAVLQPETFKTIASAPSVSLPTRLPTTIINNINTWDGTSDLVLSPPLPYDIPDDEALVVDPTYGGEVIDPTDPVDPPAEEGTIVLPWLAALLGLLGLGNPSLEGIEAGVKTAIDKLIEDITATAQDVFDGSKEIFGNITDALTGIDAGIQSGIDALTGSISVPLANVADFALSVPDFFAIPESKSIATPIIEQIPTVFPIVDQMNTALNKITVETRPLIIYYPYLDGSTKEINLNWYEPARQQVKHGVGLLFKVVTALACFAMVSNVFGIGIRVGAGQAYTDNNSGGGNSRKKED